MQIRYKTIVPNAFRHSLQYFALMTVSVCALCSLAACIPAQQQQDVQVSRVEDVLNIPKDMSKDAKSLYLYMVLTESMNSGDTEIALPVVEEMLKTAPSLDVYRDAVSIADYAGEAEKAMNLVNAGAQKYPHDITLQLMRAELLNRTQKSDKAITLLQAFIKNYPQDDAEVRQNNAPRSIEDVRQLLLRLYVTNNRYADGLALIASLPAAERTPMIRLIETQLLRGEGKNKEADSKLQNLVKTYPLFTEAWLTLGLEAERNKNYTDASKYYQKALDAGESPQVFLYLVNALIKDKKYTRAASLIEEAPVQMPEITLQSALLFLDEGQYKYARRLLLSILKKQPKAVTPEFASPPSEGLIYEVNYYLGRIAYDTGENMPEALARLQEISPDAAHRSQMYFLRALLYIKTEQHAKAEETGRLLLEEFPDNKQSWSFMVEVLNINKKHTEAEKMARNALEQWPDEISFMYTLAYSLNYQKKDTEAITVMEDILFLDSENPTALNFIGYMLAEQNKELDKALDYITRALEQDPENIAITDSMAWVLYKQGKYQDAWTNIKKCIDKGVDDPTVWEHYGDILVALNKNSDAKKAYKKALTLKPENPKDLKSKLKKLK